MGYNSLKSIYGRILTEDITYAASHHIEDKLWRYICYPNIEEVRSKLRKVWQGDDRIEDDFLLTAAAAVVEWCNWSSDSWPITKTTLETYRQQLQVLSRTQHQNQGRSSCRPQNHWNR